MACEVGRRRVAFGVPVLLDVHHVNQEVWRASKPLPDITAERQQESWSFVVRTLLPNELCKALAILELSSLVAEHVQPRELVVDVDSPEPRSTPLPLEQRH